MIERRKSKIHGWGVYSTQLIPKNTRIVHYAGEKISNQVSLKREIRYLKTGHIWCFKLTNRTVIDAGVNGNDARFINHGCEPNCEAVDDDGRIFIRTIRPIATGEELFIDYQLCIDEPLTDELRETYACRCGSARCRGTMLGV